MLREDCVQQPTEREYTKRTRDDSTGSVSTSLGGVDSDDECHTAGTVTHSRDRHGAGSDGKGVRQIWRAWRRVLTIPMVGDAVASALSVVLSCAGVYLIHFLRCDHR